MNSTRPNASSVTLEPTSLHDLYSWYVVSIVFNAIGTLSVTLLLLAIFAKKNTRTGSSILISHLLLMDFFLSAIIYPATNTVTLQAFLGQVVVADCPLVQLFLATFQHVGNWSAVCLSINRCVALLAPHHYTKFASGKVITAMIVFSWLVGLACNLPQYYGLGGLAGWTKSGDCGITTVEPVGYALRSAFGNYFPTIFVIFVYALLLGKVWYSNRNQVHTSSKPSPAEASRARRRLAVTETLFAASIWFALCYFPTPIFIAFFTKLYYSSRLIGLWMRTVMSIGYALNPVIFFFSNQEYRDGLRHLMHVRKHSNISISHMS